MVIILLNTAQWVFTSQGATNNNSSLLATLKLLETEIEENDKKLNKIKNDPETQTSISIQHLANRTLPNVQQYQKNIESRLSQLTSSYQSLVNSGIIEELNQENLTHSTLQSQDPIQPKGCGCTIN